MHHRKLLQMISLSGMLRWTTRMSLVNWSGRSIKCRCRLPPRQLEEVLPPARQPRLAMGRPPTLRPSARPCLTSLGMGGGLLAAASALRSVLPLFSPPEKKSSSSPLLERAMARHSSVFCRSAGSPSIEWGCSYLRRWNRSSVCNGTLNVSVFVHYGCRGLNMYVILARSRVFSSFSSTKTCLLII